MLKKIIQVILVLSFLGLTACQQKNDPNTVIIGTIAGPETQLMEVAKQMAEKCYRLNVKIITFSDYNTPNVALVDGSLDVNAFQHLPYFQSQITQHHYKIIPVGKTFLYPMGIYSIRIKDLSKLPPNSKVAIPNDPSNEARALLLLQAAKLIELRKGADINATSLDIIHNPKELQFVSLDAAELPRALNSVAIAVINTNYAVPAGLSPTKDALLVETTQSPYANIIAARIDNANSDKVKKLIAAYQTPEVVAEAKKLFGDAAIAGFEPKACQSATIH